MVVLSKHASGNTTRTIGRGACCCCSGWAHHREGGFAARGAGMFSRVVGWRGLRLEVVKKIEAKAVFILHTRQEKLKGCQNNVSDFLGVHTCRKGNARV